MTKITYIPGEIANAAIDEHGNRKPVTRTQHIFDDTEGKSQAEVNKENKERLDELEEAVGDGGSVDERIAEEGAKHYLKSETYNKTELNNMITTPNQEYVSVTATSQTTAVTDVLPATGAADTTYRVGNWDGTQYNDSVFSEYAWNGSAYIKLSTKSQIGEVYDISANHADTKYADLAAALGTNGANIPQSLRKGGMSVKFVQSSDNKYVQYRLMSDSFNTTPANWQGVDNEPTDGSDNLVKSGGVFNRMKLIEELFIDTPFLNKNKFQKLSESSYTYDENTILRSNGSTNTLNGWYLYTISNTLTPATTYRAILFVNNFTGRSALADIYANVEIKNASNTLIYRGIIEGYKAILIPNGWTLRFCTNDLSEAYIQNRLNSVYYTTFSIQERLAALESITYDTYPTKGSNIPVKSNGIWERENLIEGLICDNPSLEDSRFDKLSASAYSYEDNKILRADGNVDSQNGYRVYTIANDRTPASAYCGIIFAAKFIGRSNLADSYANIELKDSGNNIILRTLFEGYKSIVIPNGWTLRYSGKSDSEAYVQKAGVVSDVVLSTSIPFNLLSRLNNVEALTIAEPYRNLVVQSAAINKRYLTSIIDSSFTYEANKVLRLNGNSNSLNGFRIYTIQNDLTPATTYRAISFVGLFNGVMSYANIYASFELKDNNNKVIYRSLLQGWYTIFIPNGWTLRVCCKDGEARDMYVNTTNNNPIVNEFQSDDMIVDCVGDSHVQFGNEWITALRNYLGSSYTIYMLGCGGEGAGTIIGRMNGIPFTVKADFTIPATTTSVEIGLTNVYSQFILPLLAGPWHTFDVEIGGIAGTLSRTTEDAPVYAQYYFTRKESGNIVQIKAGEPIYINTTKVYSKSGRNKIIWLGENGGYGLNETARYAGNAELASDVDRLVNMIDTYLSVCAPTNYIIMTPYSKTSHLLEATFERHYGSACLNTRKFLVNNGIRVGIEIGLLDEDIYPTAQDVEDIANGIVPTSLKKSSSDLHLNSIGNTVLFEGMKPILSNIWNL